VTDPGTQGDGTVMLAQPFMASPYVTDQPGVAQGQIIMFNMPNSTTFNDGPRNVAVYVPFGYVSGTEIPFVVAQDGVAPQNGGSFGLDDLRPILDNFIAQKMLPMMAGIFVDPAGMRSVEYDTLSDRYYTFVETELLPAAVAQVQMQAQLTLNLTKDPEGRSTFGGSSGGAAALTMGWLHPESYRRILTLSGSFVQLQTSPMYPEGCADYAYANTPNGHLIANNPPKPLRVFMAAGTNDLAGGEWKAANDATGAAFAMQKYHYRYVIAQGATHEDDAARRDYLPDAMLWLWRGYPIAP
jgi:iron(III)-enterobactin esterase